MTYDAKALAASRKYKEKSIKRVPLDMQLTDYEALKAAAAAAGEPVNTYIKRAIQERIERDSSNN